MWSCGFGARNKDDKDLTCIGDTSAICLEEIGDM